MTALCTKLRLGRARAVPGEWIGGSTYSMSVWDGHPLQDEALRLLQHTRDHATSLRQRIEAYNVDHVAPDESTKKIIFYSGQTVLGIEDEGADG